MKKRWVVVLILWASLTTGLYGAGYGMASAIVLWGGIVSGIVAVLVLHGDALLGEEE